jgi:hypothetical protein
VFRKDNCGTQPRVKLEQSLALQSTVGMARSDEYYAIRDKLTGNEELANALFATY